MMPLALRLQASAASWSGTTADHINRSSFSGVLCRLGMPSDAPPHGSGGKLVVITAEAARRALPSLISMGVNAAPNLDTHSMTNKVGCITAARIESNAILIEGVLWPSDNPNLATRIAAAEASLGFSFEALVSAVENVHSDPLVVTECTFTGTALIQKSLAAYRSSNITLAPNIQENPMTSDLRLAAGAAVFTDRMTAAANTVPVPRELLRIMAAADIKGPADIDRLSEEQLSRMLENKTPGERMGIRNAVEASGLYPRNLPTARPLRIW